MTANGGRSRSRVVLVTILALVVAAAVAAVALTFRSRPATVHTVPARRGDLLVRVLCDGNLEPPAGGELRAGDGGTVAAIAVRDGERVRQGEVLLRLDNREIAAALRQAEADLSRLSSERAAAAADLDRGERDAAARRRVADADRRLVGLRALPAATAEADELAAREAEDQARSARAQLAGIAGGSGGTSGSPSRLALAQAAARDLARRAAALTVRAPFDGVAYGLPRAAGQVVAPGELVASVTAPAAPRVRFRIDQPDLPRVAVGQRLLVLFAGLPDRRWEGQVTAAPGALKNVGGREVGEALGRIADPGRALPLNAAVDVEVVVAERRGVLTIPRGALRRQGARRFVYVVDGGRAARRDVQVGLVGLSDVEVTSGLAPGDPVVADAAAELQEGERVRTAAT
jgi:HlyD family secretion protein